MTDKELSFPGNYYLRSATLYSAPSAELRESVNIRNLIANLSITESMNNDCIRGSVDIVESTGLLEDYPLRGEEMLFIDIEDPMGNRIYYYMFIYKIDNVITSYNNDLLSYTLHLVSSQRFKADQNRVTSSYNKQVSEVVEDIFNSNYIQRTSSRSVKTSLNKFLTVEPTEGKVKIIVPRMTPAQAMKFLESRAYSSASPSCSFRFFESSSDYYFVTDEFLYKKAVEQDKIFEFTFAENLSKDNSNFINRMNNFESFKNTSRVDTIDDLHGGSYHNVVVSLDINSRTVEYINFNYMEKKDTYFAGLSDSSEGDKHSSTFVTDTFTPDNARRMIMVKDYVGEQTGQLRGEQFIPQIAANRLAYFKNLNSIRVSAAGPGRLDITCGDFIRVNVPEFSHVRDIRNPNRQLSGVFLVESVTRVFNGDVYSNQYSLVKRNWARGAPSFSSSTPTS